MTCFIGKNLSLGIGKDFLTLDVEITSHKRGRLINWISSKSEPFALQQTLSRKWKQQDTTRRKYSDKGLASRIYLKIKIKPIRKIANFMKWQEK